MYDHLGKKERLLFSLDRISYHLSFVAVTWIFMISSLFISFHMNIKYFNYIIILAVILFLVSVISLLNEINNSLSKEQININKILTLHKSRKNAKDFLVRYPIEYPLTTVTIIGLVLVKLYFGESYLNIVYLLNQLPILNKFYSASFSVLPYVISLLLLKQI